MNTAGALDFDPVALAKVCGTVLPSALTASSSLPDLGDSSSEDGDHLVTPLIDSRLHSCEPFLLGDLLGGDGALPDARATPASFRPHSPRPKPQCLSSCQRPLEDTSIASSADIACSPTSSRRQASSPDLEAAIMLCTSAPTLLDTRIAFDDSFDVYPASPSSLEAPEDLGSCMFVPAHGSPAHLQLHPALARLSQHSPQRPRSPLSVSAEEDPFASTDHSRSSVARHNGCASPGSSAFLPSTLGRTYSLRFPVGHCLRADFVRAYVLEAELGAGGYGFVMAARHRTGNYEVAVKFIAKMKIPRHGWCAGADGHPVPKESVFLSMLDHPGIVKFHELFEDNIYFYLVEELHGDPWVKEKASLRRPKAPSPPEDSPTPSTNQPTAESQTEKRAEPCSPRASEPQTSKKVKLGKGPLAKPTFTRRVSHDLFECIEQSKHKRFSEEDAKYVFAQVVDVVDYLDKLGITHCDIKDENVVIDKNLKIKLIDFGSLVATDPSQPRPFYKRFFGTTAYASPEIVYDKPYQAPVAEVWALGVLLSFLLTGMSPFQTEEDKLAGRITFDKATTRRLSSECMNLLRSCLKVDPVERASIADVKSHPWLQDALARDCTQEEQGKGECEP